MCKVSRIKNSTHNAKSVKFANNTSTVRSPPPPGDKGLKDYSLGQFLISASEYMGTQPLKEELLHSVKEINGDIAATIFY